MTSGQKQLTKPAATKFSRCGKNGATISEWLPHLQGVADDVCFIKSMHTDQINHAPAMTQFVTGNPVHVHDLHATVLPLLGIDHERLTCRHQGLDFRLTGIEPARVVKALLA